MDIETLQKLLNDKTFSVSKSIQLIRDEYRDILALTYFVNELEKKTKENYMKMLISLSDDDLVNILEFLQSGFFEEKIPILYLGEQDYLKIRHCIRHIKESDILPNLFDAKNADDYEVEVIYLGNSFLQIHNKMMNYLYDPLTVSNEVDNIIFISK